MSVGALRFSGPGELRHRVSIERPVVVKSATGAEKVGFEQVCEVAASVTPRSGRETTGGNMITAEMDTCIRIRWSPTVDAITAKWRIQFRGVVYNITQVSHLEFGMRVMELMCSSGVNRS